MMLGYTASFVVILEDQDYYASYETWLVLATTTYEDFKNAHEHSTMRMRLGLHVSLLIGNIQICVLGYILQLRPIISFHAYVRVFRISAST